MNIKSPTCTCSNCGKELDSYVWFNGPVCKECKEILTAGPENKIIYSREIEDFEFLAFLDGRG